IRFPGAPPRRSIRANRREGRRPVPSAHRLHHTKPMRLFRRTTGTGRRSPRLVTRGAFVLGAAGVIIWSALTLRIPFWPAGGQIITARLASVADAHTGQPVRISGVDVGEIAGV